MTTPRIETNESHSIDASYADAPECVGEPAPIEVEQNTEGEHDSEDLQESRDFFDEAIGDVNDTLGDWADAARDCVENPSDKVARLEDGETAVGELGGSLELKEGIGGSIGASAEYEVERSNDDYEARFTAEMSGGAGLGASVQDLGIGAEVGGAQRVRVTATGQGDEARAELAEIVDLGSPSDIPDAIEHADDVELKSVVWETDLGVKATGGAGSKIENTATLLRGVEVDESGEARAIAGVRVETTGAIETQAVNPGNEDVAADMLGNAVPVPFAPEEFTEELVRLNGGEVGLRAEVSASIEAKHAVDGDGTTTSVQGTFRGTVGGRSVKATMTGSYDRSSAVGEKIDQAIRDGDFEKARRLGDEYDAGNFDVVVEHTEFDGCRTSGLPVDFTNGTEKSYKAFHYQLR